MYRLPTTIALVVLLCGCSADWHLRKAISKDPSILLEGTTIIYDTVTVVRPELRVDTLHTWRVDTVTSYVDRVRIRTKVDTVNRTVYVDVVCPADTIRVPYESVVIQPVVGKPKQGLWLVGLVVLLIAVYLSRRM
jgi:hypothetical protein